MPGSYLAVPGDIIVDSGVTSVGAQIAYLTGGRFVAMGNERLASTLSRAFFQVYSADGDPIGARTTLLGSSADIASISGDRFLVAYVSEFNGALQAQIYDAGGVAIGSPLAVSTGTFLRAGETIALADGGFLISWGAQYSGNIFAGQAQRYDAAGNKVGAAFALPDALSVPEVTQLAGGELVFTWTTPGSDSDIVAAIYAVDGTPIGLPFPVNSVTAGAQNEAEIASLASGGFVIIWSGAGEVKGQLYDANGVAVGGEFLVNDTVAGSQSAASVVALPGGGFLVSWTDGSGSGADGSGTAIKGQYFEDTGARVGHEVVLNATTTQSDQLGSGLGVSSTGDIAVGFIHVADPVNAFGRELRIQLLEPIGPTTDTYAGSPDLALTAPTNSAVFPTMTGLAGGGFAFSWEVGAPGAAQIRTQAYDAFGRKIGPETLLSDTGVIPLQNNSAIGALSDGGFVVIWNDDGTGSGGAAFDIKAQRFDAGGNKVGGEIDVNTITTNGQWDAAVAGLPGGGFVAAWRDLGGSGGDGSGSAVKAQLFDASGAKVGGEFLVNTTLTSDQIQPAITALSGDRFMISWATNSSSSGEISAQLYQSDGTRIGSELTVGTGLAPSVTELAGGGFVIAWQTVGGAGGGEIRAQIFDSAGNEIGAELAVNSDTPSQQRDALVAALPDGRFIVTWTSFGSAGASNIDVKAQIFEANGERFGGEFRVNQIGAGSQSQPGIAVLTNGDFFIGWSDNGTIEARAFSPSTGAELRDDAFATNESTAIAGNLFLNNGSGSDATPIGNAFTVAEINGAWFALGQPILLASGALLTVNADGSFSYDPSDAFNALVAPGSGSPSQATESFTYGAYGDIATVTITITGVDPAPGAIEGTAGNDNLAGTAAGETIDAFQGDDRLFGNGGADTLIGGAGDDYLHGGSGTDTLRGGLGNDIYVVDGGDMVVEAAGGGFDQVYSSTSYVLTAGASIDVLSVDDYAPTNAIDLTGNALGQQVFGNAGANTLNGGGGADALYGFGGDDTYVVESDDIIFEGSGLGFDIVYASTSFALAAGVEIEILSASDLAATTALRLTGNALGQQILGNAGANFLIGGGGVDTLAGGAGDDIYSIDGDDIVTEAAGGGFDQVYSSTSYALAAGVAVEVLAVNDYAATSALNLAGNALGQQILGNAGANILDGGGGTDGLYGRGGADTFAFTVAGGLAYIADMNATDDTIALDDAVFGTLAPGALDPNAFVLGTAAQDADDRIIYDQATGSLFYDADGSGAGAAILFAVLVNRAVISANDFVVM